MLNISIQSEFSLFNLVKLDEYELQFIHGQIHQIVSRREVKVTKGKFILDLKTQHGQAQ